MTGTIAWIALVIAVYRNILFSRQTDQATQQAKSAAEQAKIAAQQADTAVQSHLNDRYKTGTELLGDSVLSVRIGGIYILAKLADEHPEYHIEVMKLFCFTVRFPPHDKAEPDNKSETKDKMVQVREDIQEIMTIVSKRKKERIKDEREADYRLYLRGANLTVADLSGADLSKADLIGANLYLANLSKADLTRADLMSADLRKANLIEANLEKARITSAILSSANLSDVKGLTQYELGLAKAPSSPPTLTGAIDPVTKQPLKW